MFSPKTCDPCGWPFVAPGHNLNKHGSGPPGDATTKYHGSMPCEFRQEGFICLTYISLCKICGPGAGPFLAPGASR